MFKSMIKRAWYQLKTPKRHKSFPCNDLSPLFVLGTNRSGTSVVTSLLSQHPQLEGIFRGNTSPERKSGESHTHGFCESDHIWSWLNDPKSQFHSLSKFGSLWCHPQYISEIYRLDIKDDQEALMLLNTLETWRTTEKTPLIKDQLNLLRVGLIKKILPNAKFILVVRDFDDYFSSCRKKWFLNKGIKEHPSIGSHWMTGNSVGLYDLGFYYEGNFSIINYNELISSNEKASNILNNSLEQIGLDTFTFDLSPIDKSFRFSDEDSEGILKFEPDFVSRIVKDEKRRID